MYFGCPLTENHCFRCYNHYLNYLSSKGNVPFDGASVQASASSLAIIVSNMETGPPLCLMKLGTGSSANDYWNPYCSGMSWTWEDSKLLKKCTVHFTQESSAYPHPPFRVLIQAASQGTPPAQMEGCLLSTSALWPGGCYACFIYPFAQFCPP